MTELQAQPSDAEKCRHNGWKAGTLLIGNEGYGNDIIRITAVGEERILARHVAKLYGSGRHFDYESTWCLDGRDWAAIDENQARNFGAESP